VKSINDGLDTYGAGKIGCLNQKEFNQIMHMITHNAEGIKLKAKLLLTFFDCIKQHFPAFQPSQPKLSIVATSRDVVAISRLKFSITRHDLKSVNALQSTI
jgi:hypothetical protein